MAQILVIDDDTVYRMLLKQVLAEGNHEVILAKSGEESLTQYREKHPDLVITDLIMEGMSGSEVIRALRDEFQNVKIIGISSGASDFPQVEHIRGANRVFSKPIDPDELLETIAKMLSKDT